MAAPMGLMAVAPRSEAVREELQLVDWEHFAACLNRRLPREAPPAISPARPKPQARLGS
jgi:hypothetical protein